MDAIENWKQRLEARGMARGIARGEARGEARVLCAVAKALLQKKTLSLKEIAETTTLSLDKIKELQASL